jgi:hypothetical protein
MSIGRIRPEITGNRKAYVKRFGLILMQRSLVDEQPGSASGGWDQELREKQEWGYLEAVYGRGSGAAYKM